MEMELLTAIQGLQTTIEQQTEVLARYIALEEEKRNQSEWISAEEASRILGLNKSKTTNKRKLDNAVKRYAVRHTRTRPRKYSREDIHQLNRKVLDGRAMII